MNEKLEELFDLSSKESVSRAHDLSEGFVERNWEQIDAFAPFEPTIDAEFLRQQQNQVVRQQNQVTLRFSHSEIITSTGTGFVIKTSKSKINF